MPLLPEEGSSIYSEFTTAALPRPALCWTPDSVITQLNPGDHGGAGGQVQLLHLPGQVHQVTNSQSQAEGRAGTEGCAHPGPQFGLSGPGTWTQIRGLFGALSGFPTSASHCPIPRGI